MPVTGNVFTRIWSFASQFNVGDPITRANMDIAHDDAAVGINAALTLADTANTSATTATTTANTALTAANAEKTLIQDADANTTLTVAASDQLSGTFGGTASLVANATGLNLGSADAPRLALDLGRATDGLTLPAGTTAQRLATPTVSTHRHNTTTARDEKYINSTWFNGMMVLPAGGAVPTTDIGPFWSEDEAEVMAWNATAGAYRGQSPEKVIAEIDLPVGTAAAAYDIPAEFTVVALRVERFQPVTNNSYLAVRIGTGGSASAFVSAGYVDNTLQGSAGTASAIAGLYSELPVLVGDASQDSYSGTGRLTLRRMNTANSQPTSIVEAGGVQGVTDFIYARHQRLDTTGQYNAIQLFCTDGTNNLTFQSLRAKLVGLRNG